MLGLAVKQRDVVNLSIGEPDFDTPQAIIERGFEDALNGHTHYTASQGDPELLEKLSEQICRETAQPVTPSSILVTHGAMGALTSALRTLLDPGEEAILIEPHFPDYAAHVILAGGQVVSVPARFEGNFIPRADDIEKAVTPSSKVIVLNSPNNPTGAVLPGNLLDSIADIAKSHDLMVISDEVYEKLLFEGKHDSIYNRSGMEERTLVIKSFSKSHAMTGWRIGYCYGPQMLIDEMLKVVNYSTACASSVGQRAAIAALELGLTDVARFRRIFFERMNLVHERLCAMPGIRAVKPQGGIYVFASIEGVMTDSRKFAIELLKESGVVVIPGYAFGKSAEGCIRIACTQDISLLQEGLDRLEAFVTKRRSRS